MKITLTTLKEEKLPINSNIIFAIRQLLENQGFQIIRTVCTIDEHYIEFLPGSPSINPSDYIK